MRNREAQIQASIVAWIRANAPDVVVYAVLNDGLFTRSEAAKRKWMGLLPGIPDLAIVHDRGAAFLEIKPPGCKPTDEQSEMMEALESLGARCAVVRSVAEARAFLEAVGILVQQAQELA
jgi:hypothetical protein